MPPGNKSGQAGNSVPLLGESEIQGQSTGIDILTITAPSTMDGDFLVIRSNVPEGSTRTDTELLTVSSNGVLVANAGVNIGSGTTGQLQISTAGVVKGLKFNTTTYSTAANATAVTLAASNSGNISILSGWASAALITMPVPAAGMNYMFYYRAKGAGAVSYAGDTTSARMHAAASTGSDKVSIATAVELNSWVWWVSDGTEWYGMTVRDGSSAGFPSTTINSTAAAGPVVNHAVAAS